MSMAIRLRKVWDATTRWAPWLGTRPFTLWDLMKELGIDATRDHNEVDQ